MLNELAPAHRATRGKGPRMTQEQAVNRKARVGTVVSDVNDQTVVVEIERASLHRIYR